MVTARKTGRYTHRPAASGESVNSAGRHCPELLKKWKHSQEYNLLLLYLQCPQKALSLKTIFLTSYSIFILLFYISGLSASIDGELPVTDGHPSFQFTLSISNIRPSGFLVLTA